MRITGEITPDSLKMMRSQFSSLNDAYQTKALQSAIRAAAIPMRDTAKTKASGFKLTGALEQDIKVKTHRRRGTVESAVGVEQRSRRSSLGHLIEFGTSHSVPRPFLRPAFDENKGKSAEIFAMQLRKNMSRIVARAKKQGALR